MMAEQGVIPPVARRKLKMKEIQRRKEARRALLLGMIFVIMVMIFLAYNIYYFTSHRPLTTSKKTTTATTFQQEFYQPKLRGVWVSRSSQPFNENNRASKAHHLVMVAGHSVTVAGNLEDAGTDENVWFLLDYQKGKGLPQAIVAHIKAGIEVAHHDPDSLLIFSGGETRSLTGPITEGGSYFRVADAMNLWPQHENSVRARTVTEEFATDSFENLLFSICRFKEVTGNYPTKITTVSFTFKQRRFETLHAPALRWPNDAFEYIGVDPPASTGFDLQASTQGEYHNAALPFESDPYGCHSPVLQDKRLSRNPFSRTPPYKLSCPELESLLSYCGPELFPKEQLPWG